jgi:hypothetical protein
MKKVARFLAGALGVVGVAMLLPANVFAVCPPTANQTIDQCSAGGEVLYNSADAGQLSGTFWIQGLGNDALDVGVDAGKWAGAPGIPGTSGADGNWLADFAVPDSRCISWDWGSGGTDGCPDGGGVLWVVVSDGANRSFIASVSGGSPNATRIYDFGAINNGAPAPNFGGATNGTPLGRSVHVTNSATAAGDVTLNVAALTVPHFDEVNGARALPGTVRLRGFNGGPVIQTGSGTHSIAVDQDSDLCWEIVDGSFTVPLGCVRVGGLTPSQNVLNAKAAIGRGQLNFSWEVSAQFDVLGFNVIQKNATKGTERKVNDSLIPINGMNDAQAAQYRFSATRKDLQATRGGFEIELVRTNGETSRTPAPLR